MRGSNVAATSLLGALLVGALACGHKAPAHVPVAAVSNDQLLITLSILTRAEEPTPAELADWSGRLTRHQATLEQYIDHMLDSPTFRDVIAPAVKR